MAMRVTDKQNENLPDQSPIEQVALIVPTTDDPEVPVLTFRVWALGVFTCCTLSFLNNFFSYQAEPISVTLTTAVIIAMPMGKLLAAVLPDKRFCVPLTEWSFTLNPGPFSTKEHALITIFASAGVVRSGGLFVVNAILLFYKRSIGFVPSFFLLLTTEMLGLSWAGLLKKQLVEPAEMWWPATLTSVSLIESLHDKEKSTDLSRVHFFLICLMCAFAYYILPGYFVPSLGAVSVMCYAFPRSVVAQQLGSGLRGLGVGAFSLDWATISAFLGSPLVAPWTSVANSLAGLIISLYILLPLLYFRNFYKSKNFPLFSAKIFAENGRQYDVRDIVTSGFTLNTEVYEKQGIVYTSAFFTLTTGISFAVTGATLTHVALFYGRTIMQGARAAFTSQQEIPDVHTRLMKSYEEVPYTWFGMLFLGISTITMLIVEGYTDQLQMRWWGLVLGFAVAAVLMIPFGIVMATTNQLLNITIMSQYLMGLISPGEPITNIVFRNYSTLINARALTYMGNFKLGYYMKIAPRAQFCVQVASILVSTITNMGVTWWLMHTQANLCNLDALPPESPWTCPTDRVFYDQSVIWGLIGTERVFGKHGAYSSLNWYFLIGAILPCIVWIARRRFPTKAWIKIINIPILLQAAGPMPPATAVHNLAWTAVATFNSFYVFLHRKAWWKRYNYVLSAALDAGTAIMGVSIYFAFDFGRERIAWWGSSGDHCLLASCPSAPDIKVPGCPNFGHSIM